MKTKVKEPKRAKKAMVSLYKLVDQLEYFYQNKDRFKKEVLKDAMYIEEILHSLSVDKKIENAKFISKFKHLFAKENEELREKNRKLREELQQRGNKIQELSKEIKELKDE